MGLASDLSSRSLERLGYYERPEWGLGDFTDDRLFEGVRRFQKDNGLTVDGVMNPGGETERSLVPQLAELAPSENNDDGSSEVVLNPDSKPSKDQCDDRFDQEYADCGRYLSRDGAKEVAICRATAASRYAACLRGLPTHLLPPLYNPRLNR